MPTILEPLKPTEEKPKKPEKIIRRLLRGKITIRPIFQNSLNLNEKIQVYFVVQNNGKKTWP